MKKKILLFLLVGIISTTSLMGCGKKETGSTDIGSSDDYEINLGYYN